MRSGDSLSYDRSFISMCQGAYASSHPMRASHAFLNEKSGGTVVGCLPPLSWCGLEFIAGQGSVLRCPKKVGSDGAHISQELGDCGAHRVGPLR